MDRIPLLLALKWKLTCRIYLRSSSAIVGVILMVLFFLPLSLLIAGGLGLAFFKLQHPFPQHVLQAALMLAWSGWILTPLLGYSTNDSYDLSRLFVFPVSYRAILLGAVLGQFTDIAMLFIIPTLLVTIAGFTSGVLSALFVTAALLLFLLHTFAMSQVLVLGAASIVQSRRIRDLGIVLIPIISILFYLAFQLVPRYAGNIQWGRLLEAPLWTSLRFLPFGSAAWTASSAAAGNFAAAAFYLLLLVLYTAGSIFLAARLLEKAYSGETSTGFLRLGRKQQAPTAPAARPARSALPEVLPPEVAAVTRKELTYFLRDPVYKLLLINSVYTLTIFFIVILFSGRGETGSRLGVWMPWAGAIVLLFSQTQLALNIFGSDGPASATLFGFPAGRASILLGKNLAVFTMFVLINILAIGIISLISRAAAMGLLALTWTLMAATTLLAVGNIGSLLFPYRYGNSRRVRTMSAGQGCLIGLVQMAASFLATLLSLPTAAALALPVYFNRPVLLAVTLPAAAIYCAFIYGASLFFGSRMLVSRELRIVELLSQGE